MIEIVNTLEREQAEREKKAEYERRLMASHARIRSKLVTSLRAMSDALAGEGQTTHAALQKCMPVENFAESFVNAFIRPDAFQLSELSQAIDRMIKEYS